MVVWQYYPWYYRGARQSGELVTQHQKLLEKIRNNPRHVRFREITGVLERSGCVINDDGAGSHVTVERDGLIETLARPHGGDGMMKPYQVRRVLQTFGLWEDEQ